MVSGLSSALHIFAPLNTSNRNWFKNVSELFFYQNKDEAASRGFANVVHASLDLRT